MIRLVGIVFLSCAIMQFIYSQNEQWRNYTAMNQARSAVQHDGVVYVVTSGGLFSYTNNGEIIETLTTSEGLSAIDLTAIVGSESGKLWIGTSSGSLDGYNPIDHSWTRVRDIARTDFAQRDITTLASRGDTLYVGSSFGVSVYSISRNEFNDSYIKFGDFPTQTPTTAIAYDENYIWIATPLGLARGNIDDPLLAAPDRWTTFSEQLPSEMVNDVAIFDDYVYTATSEGLAYYDGNAWNTLSEVQSNVVALASDNFLYFATERDVYRMDRNHNITSYGDRLPDTIAGLFAADGTVKVLVRNYGVARLEGSWHYTMPDGPSTNFFVNIDIDRYGNVWVGTGATTIANGFMRFSPDAGPDEQWWNIPRLTYSFQDQQTSESRNIALFKYHNIRTMEDGTVWLSLWGEGISRFVPENPDAIETTGDIVYEGDSATIEHFYLNQGLQPISGSTSFMVIGSAAMDSERNVWITNYNADNGMPLASWYPDGTWEFHRNLRNTFATNFTDIIVDRYDTKWILSADPAQRGLFYFNEHLSIGNNTSGWGVVTSTNGLPSNNINTVVGDNRGEIWVGTEAGLAAIANPQEPQASVRDIFVLRDQYINSIAVDPLNRKWVGTQEGVFLVSPDGTSLVRHYNMQNTDNQLLTNDVQSVAFDGEKGIAYFGTNRGLSSVQTVAVTPRTAFDDLFIAPNPYRIPAEHAMKIDGLMRNSSVKILSVDGRLVRSFDSPGGRVAFWDGRDEAGRQVASGVYIVVGVSEDGTEVGKSKVTIIRR